MKTPIRTDGPTPKLMRIETIPIHIEYIDCHKCAKVFIKQIIEGKTTNPKCDVCGGEGVVRADGKPVLKTRITNYIQPQFRSGSFEKLEG